MIGEFQRAIDTDAEGEWADDAQYAIASCWLWLGQRAEQPALDNAIAALTALLQDYPGSPYTGEAHYWLGDCHDRLQNYGAAVPHYQTVISHYANHAIADKAQLRIGRAYEAQGYLTLARITYEALSQRSRDSQIVAQAKKLASRLEVEQTEEEAPVEAPPEIVSAESPKVVQPSPPKTQPEVSKPPPVSPKSPQSSAPVLSSEKSDAKPKTVAASSKPELPSQKPPVAAKLGPPIEAKPAPEPPKTPQVVPDPSLAQQLGLGVKTIVIDPGHGGKDPGAVSQARQEKQIVPQFIKNTPRPPR